MNNKIDLSDRNRYHEPVYLQQIEDTDYYKLFCLYTYRVIGEDPVQAVDPSGGPFISVGDTFENLKITQISRNGVLKLEPVG